MADPLSISAGIAGLITTADLVFCRTFKYVKDVKGAPKQITALSRGLSHLYGILNSLNLLALQLDVGILDTTIQLDHVHACHHTLEKIKSIIDRHEGRPSQDHAMRLLKKKMKWPFSISEAKDLLAEVEGHKSTLSLALTADVLYEQHATASDIREIRQELQEKREAETRIALSKENQTILDSISSIDPYKNHETNLKVRHPGTGHWFTKGDEFNRWLATPKARLWLYGIPGAGKSILCSSVVEIALAKSNRDIAVAFFYCDYKDTATQDPSNILGSLAKQIAMQDEQSFEKLQKFHQSSRDSLPSVRYDPEDLRNLILSMASNYDHIMIVVDGLDECRLNSRVLVDLLASLNSDLENSNIKTLFLSRHEQDIKEILNNYAQVSIAANIVDLRLYVGAEIEARMRRKKLRIKDQSLKDHIMERLVEGAEGMFRWVTCQMDYLCELTNDTARRKALNSLPPTLNATYERILRRVNDSSQDAQKMVQRTLRWIVHSRTSLSIPALSEAVSINIGDTVLDRDAMPHEDEILRHCSSLVRRSAVGPGLELAHFTVKEFLNGLEECQSNEFGLFRINPVDTNVYIAEVCLTYLNLQDFCDWDPTGEGASQRSEKKYALRRYAVEFWADHSRRHLSQATILSLTQKLLHPTKPNAFLNWAREYARCTYTEDDCDEVHEVNEFDDPKQKLLSCLGSTGVLHYAAMLALPTMCDWLIENGCQVNQQSRFGAPLHCALLGRATITIILFGEYDNYYIEQDNDCNAYQDMTELTIEIIVGAGADVHCPYSNCFPISPLCIAVYREYWSTSTVLLKKGAVVDRKTADRLKIWGRGNSRERTEYIGQPLHEVEATRHAILRKFALEFDISVNESAQSVLFSDTCASLRVAAEFGQVGIVKRILDDASLDINSIDKSSGCTALHEASAADHAEIVELLLERNANYNAVDDEGNTPLHCSAESGGWHSLSMLLKQGPHVPMKNHAGFSVWHLAARRDNIKALEVLERYMVCCKHSTITVTQDGDNPMPSCVPDGSAQLTVPIDFYKGQSFAIRSLDSATPIHIAARGGCVRAVRFFVDNGFDISALTSDGSSALHCAVDRRDQTVRGDIVHLLLNAGANPYRARLDGMAPIHVLIETLLDGYDSLLSNEQRSVLHQLARCTGTIHQSNTENLTALHQICRRCPNARPHGDEKVVSAVQILLDHGADPRIPDGLGRTALHVLVESWKQEFLCGEATGNVGNSTSSMRRCVTVINLFLGLFPDGTAINKMCNDRCLLFLSLRFREEELAHKLLDRFHDVDREADESIPLSAIQAACRYGASHPLLQRLIQKSKVQSDPTGLGSTLIREACAGDHTTSVSVVLQLLEAGLDPNGRSPEGESALMVAARTTNPTLIKILVSHDANPLTTDKKGWSMVHHACESGHVAILPMLKSLALDWTATVRAKIGATWLQGATALHIVASREDSRILEYILDNESVANIDRTTDFTETALYVASYMGRDQNVALLLFRGADETICESRDSRHWSPLHIAAGHGHQEVVMAFVNYGCDTQIKDRLGLTPELVARRWNHSSVANMLTKSICGQDRHHLASNLPESDSNSKHHGPSEPLKVAIETQNLELCQRVVWEGASLTLGYPSCDGCTPLLYSLYYADAKIAGYLIEQGAEIAGETCGLLITRGYTAFHYAASYGWAEVLTLLLDTAPQLFMSLDSAIHPLHLAVAKCQVECCRLMLGFFDKNRVCSGPIRSGETVADVLPNLPVQCDRIRWSWYINHETRFPKRLYSATPLHIAADGGYDQIVQMLIDHGSIINAVDANHRTAIDFAAAQGHTEVIELLVQRGANPNAFDDDLESPLMTAASCGHVASSKILLQSGADPRVHDVWGRTVLHHAAINKSKFSVLLPILKLMNDHELGVEDSLGESALVTILEGASTPKVMAMLNFAPHPSVYVPRTINVLTAVLKNRAIEASAIKRLLRRVPPDLVPELLAHRALYGGTPLYAAATIAAPRLQGDFINILLHAGAELDLEGGDFGTPLMGTCAAGRLPAVTILVSKGAAICYRKDGQMVSALRAAKHFPDIKRWLLVGRFEEGPRLLEGFDSG